MKQILIRFLFLSIGSLGLIGCTYSPAITDRTIGYNHAVAESTDELLLLNAVRASRREPTYYTRNTGDTAQSTITPGLSLSNPLGNAFSFAPPMTIPKTISTTAKSLTASLSTVEQNQIALQNLDDQASMQGLITPTTLQTLDVYAAEGWNLEQLMLIFVNDISLPRKSLEGIPAALSHVCAPLKNPPQTTQEQYCLSLSSQDQTYAPCFAGVQIPDLHTRAIKELSWKDVARVSKTGDETITLINDPAFDVASLPKDSSSARIDPSEDQTTFTCFQVVLRSLLALGLEPVESTSYKAFYRLPLSAIQTDSQFFSDITQQDLVVAKAAVPTKLGGPSRRPTEFGVCKKTTGTSLTFHSDNYVLSELGLIEASPPGEKAKYFRGSVDSTTGSAGGSHPEVQVRPSADTDAGTGPKDTASATDDSCAHAATNWDNDPEKNGKFSKAASIKFNLRSFESIIYFLGEIIRRGQEHPEWAPVSFVSRYDPSSNKRFYDQVLFHVHTGIPPIDTLASVEHDATIFYVPNYCDPDVLGTVNRNDAKILPCSAEFPRHSSAQILTLLNQLWGLQKTAATAPAVLNATVISPP